VATAWTKVGTKDELDAKAGKMVVVVGGNKILVTEHQGTVYAVSNRCSHLGLPIEGKLLKAQFTEDPPCVVCAAHNTAFSLTTGEVVGEWAPRMPDLPIVGKGTKPTPLPTFPVRIGDSGDIEIMA